MYVAKISLLASCIRHNQEPEHGVSGPSTGVRRDLRCKKESWKSYLNRSSWTKAAVLLVVRPAMIRYLPTVDHAMTVAVQCD
jgi:hypothetical protein